MGRSIGWGGAAVRGGYLVLMVLVSAARISRPGSASVASADSVTVAKVATLILGTSRYGDMDTFGAVLDARVLANGNLVVLDGKPMQVKVFTPAGKFLRNIGQPGEGPGDYRGAWTLLRAGGDTVMLWDPVLNRITMYGTTGNVLLTEPIPRTPVVVNPRTGRSGSASRNVIGRFPDGGYLSYRNDVRDNSNAIQRSDSLTVEVSNEKTLSVVGRLYAEKDFVYSNAHGTTLGARVPFSPVASLATDGNAWFYNDGASYDIQKRDESGRLVATLRFSNRPRAITPHEIADFRAAFLAEGARAGANQLTLYGEALSSVKMPAVMPAIDMIAVDALGRIWAREYVFQSATAHWLIMSKSGSYVGSVVLDAKCAPLQIGSTFLLAHCKDADDIDTVQLFELRG